MPRERSEEKEMKEYKPHLGQFLFSSLATICLGIFLLIPILNNYILNFIIEAETGIKTNYYHRPLGSQIIFKSKGWLGK